jgi:SRSO17 transposase
MSVAMTRLPSVVDPSPRDARVWSIGLDQLHSRLRSRFARAEPRRRALSYLKALLGPAHRKNGWQIAEQVGEATPDGIQRLLNTARWDADAVGDDLRVYVVEHLGDPHAVLVLDETSFVKQGDKSVGVQKQYAGEVGKLENCQVGVFLGYCGVRGHTLLDRELYLPKEWASDRTRRREAKVPDGVRFATKPQLARRLLERAFAAGVPSRWITADSVYGSDRSLRRWLEEGHRPFVLAVRRDEAAWFAGDTGFPHQVRAWKIAAMIPESDWHRISAGEGSKGPRLFDWAVVPLARWPEPGWRHWLLLRRSISDPKELAYYVTYAPEGTRFEELVGVAGSRWSVESCFELGKQEVGLGHYEVRHWHGWYRHITLAMLALAYLVVVRSQATPEASGGKRGGVGRRVHRADSRRPCVSN